VSISFGAPAARRDHFIGAEVGWTLLEPIRVPRIMVPDTFYWVYCARKNQ